MKLPFSVLPILGTAVVIGLIAFERDAEACGGCFTRPENPTVVTDHRMILTAAADQSTLYDQIRYTGSPESFGWVLPYSGEITLGISSDTLFSALDRLTQTQIVPPPQNCPPRPDNCQSPLSASRKSNGGAENDEGVTVLAHQVVGPYETVQLAATNPTALEDWLAKNGYTVPDDVKPTVAAYQAEHFNFLALKLVPGQGIQDMRPVRVTTKGSNVALPLRMVAAGTGATVGITLWVVAEGRYQPQNFDSFQINADELSWDWTNSKSNYIDLRAQKTAAGNARIWEIESSSVVLRESLKVNLQYGGNPFGDDDPALSYLPEKDAQGMVTKSAAVVETEDLATLFAGITPGAEKITRMRADLAHTSLDQDLVMKAAADQTPLSPTRQVTKELNEPTCPVYDGCEQTGTAPRSQASAETSDNNDGCKVTPRAQSSWLLVGLAFIGVAFGRSVRSKKKTHQ